MFRFTFNLMKKENEKYNKTFIKNHNDECSICLTNNSCNTWVKLDCKHVFHLCCMDKVYEYKKECPLCRQKL